jgi:hypothetical protein
MKAAAVVLLLLCGGVVALIPWRCFTCGLCGGAQVRKQAVNQNRYGDEVTSCPGCRDRGRVSFWALRRGALLDPRLRTLLQKAAGETAPAPAVAAFQDVLAAHGVTARFAPASVFAWARFVRTSRGDAVLVCGEHATWTKTIALDVHSRQLWLFDLQGRLLDSLAFESRKDVARVHLTIVPEKEGDAPGGTVLELEVASLAGFRSIRPSDSLEGLSLWRDGIGDIPPARWFKEGRVRLRRVGGRWVP